MDTRFPCPSCRRTDGVPLHHVNKDALVIYFRCEACGHVWNMPKPGERGEQHDVTERQRPA